MPDERRIVWVSRHGVACGHLPQLAMDLTEPQRRATAPGMGVCFWARTSTLLIDYRHWKKWFPGVPPVPKGKCERRYWPGLQRVVS